MSDSRKLAALKLEAGSEDPATGTFTVTSRFNPSEETALSFCVHEIGRVMRLERHTARESAGRLPTLNADVLRLVVPRETLMWLGVIERPDGETVLTALKAAVTVDEGASYFGEVALVPYDSPISNQKILFYNTLFDENAACHIAFGEAYPCLKDGQAMSKDELKARGLNDSITHVDFMVGTPDLNILGITHDGKEIPVFVDGNFAPEI